MSVDCDNMDELSSVQDQRNLNAATQVLHFFGNFMSDYNAELSSLLPEKSAQLVFNPVKIQTEPSEAAIIIDVIKSSNAEMKKILIVFSTLCLEAKSLVKECREEHLPSILNYSNTSLNITQNEITVQICGLLPALNKAVTFLRSASTLFTEMMNQLNQFYILAKMSKTMSASEIHLADVLDHAGRLLFSSFNLNTAILSSGDSLVISHLNTFIKQIHGRSVYSKILEPGSNYHILSSMLTAIKDMCLKHMKYTLSPDKLEGKVCDVFVDEVKGYIMQKINELEKSNENNYPEGQDKFAVLLIMFPYYFHVLGIHNDKIVKKILKLSMDKFSEFIVVDGNFVFYTRKYLFFMFSSLERKGLELPERRPQSKLNYPFKILEKLDKSRGKIYNQVKTWTLNMDSTLKKEMSSFTIEELNTMTNLYLEGVEESGKLRAALANLVGLHVWLSVPMSRQSVAVLFELVEMLRVVRETYERHVAAIARSLPHIVQRATLRTLTLLDKAKVTLRRKHAKNLERVVDCLSALEVAEQCLAGPATQERVLSARIALSLANQRNTFQLAELQVLSKLMQELSVVGGTLFDDLENATNCDFMSTVTSGFHHYLMDFLSEKDDSARIRYPFDASEDCLNMEEDPGSRALLAKSHCLDLNRSTREVWNKLNVEVERQLCVLAHSHRRVLSPCTLRDVPPHCADLLHTVTPFLHCQRIFHLKHWMGVKFDEEFYSLVAINPKVWRTYSEMRCLAQDNFGIPTIDDDHLPSQTSDQGPDILQIVRNLKKFGLEHRYQMNDQVFKKIPKPGQDKDTRKDIMLDHVTNSLRQHGTGIMKTTVNAAFKHLSSHLQELIKIIYKDTVKSNILREISYFNENKESLKNMYPVDRAIKLNENLKNSLDAIHEYVTQIGNVLGLVRMIRAGALRCCFGASRNLPDCTEQLARTDWAESSSEACAAATRALDEVVNTVRYNATQQTNYLKEMLRAYAPQMQAERFLHMHNFYILVPALTLNYCTKMLNHKTNDIYSTYYDDGFLMGLAFVLSITSCNSEFDSLNWFDSTKKKYKKELTNIQNQRISQADLSLMHALDMSANKYSECKKEFKLCRCLLTTARVFFREDLAEPNTKTDYFY